MKYRIARLLLALVIGGCSPSTPSYVPPYVAPSPKNFTYLFAVGLHSGLFRSSDRGATWDTVNMGLNVQSYGNIGALAVASSGSIFTHRFGHEVYKSVDNGSTWLPVGLEATGLSFNSIFAAGSSIYLPSGAGALRSTDDGFTWKQFSIPLMNDLNSFVSCDGSTFTSGTWDFYSRVGRSTDDGSSWVEADTGLPHDYFTSLCAGGRTLLAATVSSGIYRSTDGGASWTKSTGYSEGVANIIYDGRSFFAVTNPVGIAKPQLLHSTDDGATWSVFDSSLKDKYITCFTGGGNYLLAGTVNHGLFRSTDAGATWSKTNTRFSDTAYIVLGLK